MVGLHIMSSTFFFISDAWGTTLDGAIHLVPWW